jgi:hypothetical protein
VVLQIQNAGPEILATTYWQTEHARRGYLYLSFNGGALRVLVPEPIGRRPGAAAPGRGPV